MQAINEMTWVKMWMPDCQNYEFLEQEQVPGFSSTALPLEISQRLRHLELLALPSNNMSGDKTHAAL